MKTGHSSSTSLSLYLLGSFVLNAAEERPLPELRRKTRALLAYLAVAQRPYSRHELATLFCQQADDPIRALRLLLSRLRAVVGSDILQESGKAIQLDTSRIWVDTNHFVQVLEARLHEQLQTVLAEALALYQGEFLAGLYLADAPEFELWLLGYRTHLQRLYERGALILLEHYQAHFQYEAAIKVAQQLVQYNPLLEEAHYRLVLLYAQTGRREAALAQYERCRQLLVDELAVEPMPALVALQADISAGRLKAEPEALAIPAPAVPNWSMSTAFVGRESELAQLQRTWTMVQQGQSPIVLITAEAGGGKTRLVQELLAGLPANVCFVGNCYESTLALAYQPWTQLLEGFFNHLEENRWRMLPAPWLAELARLLPALAVERPSLAHSGQPEQLFAAVVGLLRLVERPFLLFLDDLQWADGASLQLLHTISERIGMPCLLIGAYRAEEAEDNPALLTLLRDWSRRSAIQHLVLPPLPAGAIEELLSQLWPQLPSDPHVLSLGSRLHQATHGNPLFIGEIVRELTDLARLPDELPVPTSLHDLIQRRLQQLPDSGRQVLESLVVLEQPASFALVQQICARSEEELLQAMELGLRWRLLQMAPQSHQVEFRHDLMRQAVGEQLNPLRRQLLHRRTAVALSHQGAKAATLAYHWRLAGDEEQEALAAAQAGQEAVAVYAHQEAIRYFERSVALLPETEQRVAVMCDLADVWMLTGKWQEAETMYQQALSMAEKQANGRLQARCQTSLGKLMARRSHYREALEWLERAHLSHTAVGDRQGAAQNIGTMGIVHWHLDEYDQALACYEHALQIDRELGDEADMAVWLGNIANVHHYRGAYQQALTGYQQALQIHLKLDKKIGAGVCLGNLGNTYRDLGDYGQAMACYEQALQYRLEAGDEAGVAYSVSNMGTLYAQMGFFTPALHCYQQALYLDLKVGQKGNVADDLGQLAKLYVSAEFYEMAQSCLDRSMPLLRKLGGRYYLCQQLLTEAMILFWQGQYAKAQLFCQESRAIAKGIHQESYFGAGLLSLRIEAAWGKLAPTTAMQTLTSWLAEVREDEERAAIQYEIWLLDKEQGEVRRKTADLYRHLYSHTPNILYRQRHQELTGQSLPAPPALSELPASITAQRLDLETLLAQVDQLLTNLL